jgi:DNA-binding response OmpR family regulator
MPRPTASPHILVIDASPHILALFHAALHRAGYRVSTDPFTTEVEPLLAAIKAMALDLIILDLMIREEQWGWQLLKLLQLDRETRQIPVIVTTAAVDLVDHLQPRLDKMGARVLRRPFHIAHLVEITVTALGRPRNGATRKQGRRRQTSSGRLGRSGASIIPRRRSQALTKHDQLGCNASKVPQLPGRVQGQLTVSQRPQRVEKGCGAVRGSCSVG